jgi:hypothetical protein
MDDCLAGIGNASGFDDSERDLSGAPLKKKISGLDTQA